LPPDDPLDPLSPSYDPMRFGPRATATTPGSQLYFGKGVPDLAGKSPALDRFMGDAMTSLGIRTAAPNADLVRQMATPLAPNPMAYGFSQPGPATSNPDDLYEPPIPYDFMRALGHGLGESPIGALARYAQLRATTNWQDQPGYDPFADGQIKDAGMQSQWQLFHGSRSADETKWIIGRVRQKAFEGEEFERMTGPTGLTAMAGGLLGDPLTYLPGTLGVKGATLGMKQLAGTLSATERATVLARYPVWGVMADSVRMGAIQGAMNVAEQSIQHGMDPTHEIDGVANDFMVPAAIGASLGLLLSSSARYSARMNQLAEDARRTDFLKGLPPAPAGLDEATVQSMAEAYRARVAAQREAGLAAGEVPANGPSNDGAFHEGALATDYGAIRREEAAADPTIDPFHPLPPTEEGSVGAALSPQSEIYRRDTLLAQGRMAPTGIGLENLPLDPVARAFKGASVAMMQLVSSLVSTGGRITVGNKQGIGNLIPIETLTKVRWNHPMTETIRGMHDEWAAYRAALGASGADPVPTAATFAGRSDFARLQDEIGSALKDRFTRGERPLSFAEFRSRVGDALNNGDRDEVTDGASRYVNNSAAQHRQLYERVKQEAVDAGVFDEVHAAAYEKAQGELRAVEKEAERIAKKSKLERWPVDQTRAAEEALIARTEDAQFRVRQTQQALDNMRDHGPQMNTAPSFRPRLWLKDKLLTNEQDFMNIAVTWLQSKAVGIADTPEAVRIAKQIHEILSASGPQYTRADLADIFQGVAGPASAHARSFQIPDALVKDFLDNDAERLMRSHINQMGTAIEMKKRFGSLDLADEIAEIQQEYKTQIAAAEKAGDIEQAEKLERMSAGAIKDAQALRDKLYGTYGASPDPSRWQSRTIRMAKQFTNLTVMGMSGITALGDLVRPLMTEGFDAMYGVGIRTLASDARSTILRLNREELELAGDGAELMNNVRALSRADTGDVFGQGGRIEQGLNKANQMMFVANGLNFVNQIDKEWAHLIISGRVNKALMGLLEDEGMGVLSAGDRARAQIELGTKAAAPRFTDADRARFAAAGIDEVIGKRIALQLKIFGQDFKSIRVANTSKWTDEEARDTYRSAMNQMTNRTVPTPGIGDRANWMSTELGGLISQYKSFGAGALVRTLQSGLQEGGSQFWYGAAASVGFAMLLNEMRSRLFNDRSTFDRPMPGVIADAVDRSSILGWFTDVNRAVETLTGNRMGIKPLLQQTQAHPVSASDVAGVVGGAATGQAFRAVGVANDFLSGHPTAQTFNNWRKVTPGGNLPYLDPVFDRLLSDGNFHRDRGKALAIDNALSAKEKAVP
jgi:hypothetical protein